MPHGLNFLSDLLLIFGVSTFIVVIFHYLRQPPLAGFIFSGALLGPYGFGWVADIEQVHALAELGIVLLLFSLGIEFSLPTLLRNRRLFLGVAPLQSLATTFFFFIILRLFHYEVIDCLLLGSMASLSSTAIVLKILQQSRQTSAPHGNLAVSVLLFQDLWVIPLLIIIPLLGAQSEITGAARASAIIFKIVESLLWILLAGVGTKYIVPFLLRTSARTRIRELFLITVFFIALGCAWFMGKVGVSMALGAFIGGMMISGSEYGAQAVSETVPFREPFLALFFVSVGMLLDVGFLWNHFPAIVGLATGVAVIKFGITATIASLLGIESKVAALGALLISQIGEFSFILAEKGRGAKLISDSQYQYFLAITLVLMLLTPLLVQYSPSLSTYFARFDYFGKHRRRKLRVPRESKSEKSDHVIVVGFGVIGKEIARHLITRKIPFDVIDINLEAIKLHRQRGISIHYGDASRREVLEAAGIHNARAALIAINDAGAIPQIVHAIRAIRPSLRLLIRINFLLESEQLQLPAGPTEFVVAEMEALESLLAKTLAWYPAPPEKAQEKV